MFVIFLLSVVVQAAVPVSLDTTPWFLAITLSYGIALLQRIDRQDIRLLAQGVAIRRKDAFMRQVVENTFDGIITFDQNGLVKSFNSASERLFGCPAKDAVGSSLQRFIAPANPSDAQQATTPPALGSFVAVPSRPSESEMQSRRSFPCNSRSAR